LARIDEALALAEPRVPVKAKAWVGKRYRKWWSNFQWDRLADRRWHIATDWHLCARRPASSELASVGPARSVSSISRTRIIRARL